MNKTKTADAKKTAARKEMSERREKWVAEFAAALVKNGTKDAEAVARRAAKAICWTKGAL